MINRQVKEWLDKIQLPVGERVLCARMLESFLDSPKGVRKFYSKQQFNNMMREYAHDNGYSVFEGNSTSGKYMVFHVDGEMSSGAPIKKITADRLVMDTCDEFYVWMKNIPSGERVRPKVLKKLFVNEALRGRMYYEVSGRRSLPVTSQLFGKWLLSLNYFRHGRPAVEGRDSQGKWLILI
jgi:hypothetical protein